MTIDEIFNLIESDGPSISMNSRDFIVGDVVYGVGIVSGLEEDFWTCDQIKSGRVVAVSYNYDFNPWSIRERPSKSFYIRQFVEFIHDN